MKLERTNTSRLSGFKYAKEDSGITIGLADGPAPNLTRVRIDEVLDLLLTRSEVNVLAQELRRHSHGEEDR